MQWSRRTVCAALPGLAAAAQLSAQEKKTLPSKIFQFDELPAGKGNPSIRNMFNGPIFEGCNISLHETELAPHTIPHPPHRHRHEEMILIIDGTLEFTINGSATRAGTGSVLFAGSNDLHGIRNPEDVPARYFVFALGPENQ